MNFEERRLRIFKKIAAGYVLFWNHRKGSYDFIRKAQRNETSY